MNGCLIIAIFIVGVSAMAAAPVLLEKAEEITDSEWIGKLRRPGFLRAAGALFLAIGAFLWLSRPKAPSGIVISRAADTPAPRPLAPIRIVKFATRSTPLENGTEVQGDVVNMTDEARQNVVVELTYLESQGPPKRMGTRYEVIGVLGPKERKTFHFYFPAERWNWVAKIQGTGIECKSGDLGLPDGWPLP